MRRTTWMACAVVVGLLAGAQPAVGDHDEQSAHSYVLAGSNGDRITAAWRYQHPSPSSCPNHYVDFEVTYEFGAVGSNITINDIEVWMKPSQPASWTTFAVGDYDTVTEWAIEPYWSDDPGNIPANVWSHFELWQPHGFKTYDWIPPDVRVYGQIVFDMDSYTPVNCRLGLNAYSQIHREGGWTSVGGSFDGGPDAASMADGHLDVYVRDLNDNISHKWYSAGAWSSGFTSIGAPPGGAASDPSAVSWANGHMQVFARGYDGKVWTRRYDTGSGWGTWYNIGGQIVGAPDAASWSSGRLDVFGRGTDNAMWHAYYANGVWSGWESLGGSFTSSPGAVSWSSGRIDVFGRGTNNALYQKRYDYTLGGWSSGWYNQGGSLSGSPDVASRSPGTLQVVAPGANSRAFLKTFENNAWSSWEDLGGTVSGGITAVSWAADHLDVYARGTDGALWHRWFNDPYGWSG